MTYTRSGTPDFSVPLSREELRVFTAIRGETSLEAVLAKTRLEDALVKHTVASLVTRGLIVSSALKATQSPKILPVHTGPIHTGPVHAEPVRTDSPRAALRWAERYGAVEQLLRARVGGRKAEAYIDQLQNCANEQTFVENARTIARRVALIVDADVGKELLELVADSQG